MTLASSGSSARTVASCSSTHCRVVVAPIATVSSSCRTVRQIRNAGDVDQQLRPRQPHGHQRHQRLPAGDNARVVALRQHGTGLVEARRSRIVKGSGLHLWRRFMSQNDVLVGLVRISQRCVRFVFPKRWVGWLGFVFHERCERAFRTGPPMGGEREGSSLLPPQPTLDLVQHGRIDLLLARHRLLRNLERVVAALDHIKLDRRRGQPREHGPQLVGRAGTRRGSPARSASAHGLRADAWCEACPADPAGAGGNQAAPGPAMSAEGAAATCEAMRPPIDLPPIEKLAPSLSLPRHKRVYARLRRAYAGGGKGWGATEHPLVKRLDHPAPARLQLVVPVGHALARLAVEEIERHGGRCRAPPARWQSAHMKALVWLAPAPWARISETPVRSRVRRRIGDGAHVLGRCDLDANWLRHIGSVLPASMALLQRPTPNTRGTVGQAT